MKLIVQIPCFNEERTLPRTVADIPRTIEGIDEVEILVIDDGSTDGKVAAAQGAGVDHVVRHGRNRGLGWAFRTGLDASLRLGADIIVNTDGDNQYAASDIPKLIRPILDGRADMVVGDRETARIAHFSRTKKLLQALGSCAVRRLAGVELRDAVSGFRALSREAALQLNVLAPFSYTIETLIQAGRKRLAIASVPVCTNGQTRPSRLFRSVPQFLRRSVAILLRAYTTYQPLRVFLALSMFLLLIGITPVVCFLYLYFTDGGSGHIQSIVLGGVALVMGFVTLLVGIVADLISSNRQLIEMTLEKVRRVEILCLRERETTKW